MTNTYKDSDSMEKKTYEELRCIRCVLERLLNHLSSSSFVDYQMEKFGKDYNTEGDDLDIKSKTISEAIEQVEKSRKKNNISVEDLLNISKEIGDSK
jgi:hypothetical protein